MRVEPAVFVLQSFDDDYTKVAETRMQNFVSRLATEVGQPRKVVNAMLEGRTVSYRLCRKVQHALKKHFPQDAELAIVLGQRAAKVCADEVIEGYSDPDANPPR
jgi:hypothetical protein